MKSISTTIKKARKQKKLTQKDISAQLYMARSTYSKLESGRTELTVQSLVKIAKALDVSIVDILREIDQSAFTSISENLELMLYQTESHLAETMYKIVPYDDLTQEQKDLLKKKGFHDREKYENTPLGGRIYKYGPKEVFGYMMDILGMSTIFFSNLITNDYWTNKWEMHKAKKFDKIEIDEAEYFEVIIVELIMPDNSERWVQIASKDFPEETTDTEETMLEYIYKKTGAVKGQFIAFTMEGYSPGTEIVK